jgi:hypothetical protein
MATDIEAHASKHVTAGTGKKNKKLVIAKAAIQRFIGNNSFIAPLLFSFVKLDITHSRKAKVKSVKIRFRLIPV